MRAVPILVSLLGLCAALPALAQQQQQMPQARGDFINAQGQSVGTASLVQTPAGVLITLQLRGLPAGLHAFHIHEAGSCDAAGGFQSAGGHYNPRDHQHGYLVQGGAHAGDMPNQFVGPDGVLRGQVLNDKVTLGQGQATLFDSNGSALVIHAQPDDYRSQPAGDAGGRIACAVIERQG
ncbi:MAG TPA: superoxide dismutase family protein [Falsiroseomonas sp.]|jgi:Cu-Zn family superoxide dismutase|nr:superoxide dismutase family protein [Falsiroseomonas sp.]